MEPMRRRRRLAWPAALLIALALGAVAFWLRPMPFLYAWRDAVLWSRGVESGYVTVDGHRLHYLAQGSGEPVLLLPGLAAQAADASPLMDAFAEHRRVYVLDFLGSGRSDRPAGADYGVPLHVRHTLGFIEAMRWRKVDVIGVSMGGWVALEAAAQRPDRIRSVVAASSGALDFETDLTPDTFAPESAEALDRAIALQLAKPAKPPRFIARDLVRANARYRPVIRRTMASMLTRRDVLDGRLDRIRQPVLVAWGDRDRVIPLAVGRRLAAGLPDSELVVLAGCGHLAVLECQDTFVAETFSFWGRVNRTATPGA